MLEAANARPRFTISLKRSTQNLQLSTSCPADYPIFASDSDLRRALHPIATFAALSDAEGHKRTSWLSPNCCARCSKSATCRAI